MPVLLTVALLVHTVIAVAPAVATTVFQDDFETGDLQNWTAQVGMVVQQNVVFSGLWAARGTGTESKAFAYKQLTDPQVEISFRALVNVISFASSVTLLRVRTATGSSILSLGIDRQGKLYTQNNMTKAKTKSAAVLSAGVWHAVELHVIVAGTSSLVEVSIDGSLISDLHKIDSLGTTPIGRVQIGVNTTGQTFDIAFDDVLVDVPTLDTESPSAPTNLRATLVESGSVALAWDPATDNVGVYRYTVYRSGPDGSVTVGTTAETSFIDATVSPETAYTYSVDAFDAAGNHSDLSNSIVVETTLDSEAPTQPTGLTASSVTASLVSLVWDRAIDNVGVAGYTVERSGPDGSATMGTTDEHTIADTSVAAGTTYTYTVVAIDWAGNASVPSSLVVTTSGASADPVIAAAGDIACDPAASGFNGGLGRADRCRQKYTSDLLVGVGLSAVLILGDNQFYCGGYQAFQQAFDPSWGRVKPIIHPVVGNHEYSNEAGGTDCDATKQALGYFGYFGAAAGDPPQGYYSFDLGAWHLIALNSMCGRIPGGCTAGSPEETWLRADLVAHPATCTLAYWHHPRWSSGATHGSSTNSDAFWWTLYEAGVDVVLNGHEHNYERFAPQTPDGVADPNGIREFIVGTGGKGLNSFGTPLANSEVRLSDAFGVLKLTLHPDGYDWAFVSETGQVLDSGSGLCH
jgi:chitodextrinase